jgi:hypothetical protein
MTDSVDETYDAEYYEWQRDGAAQSATALLPLVMELVSPASILDVGCGTGAWLRVAADRGVSDIFGVDGGTGSLVIPEECFSRVDLEEPLDLGRRYDLAICMEVAEHLSHERAASLVAELAAAADVVLFSAAIPGQGDPESGEHQNEQWQSYWAGLFTGIGYRTLDAIRPKIWEDERIAFWYRQNAFLAVAQNIELDIDCPTTIRDVVHPDLWRYVHPDLWAAEITPRVLLRQLRTVGREAVRMGRGRIHV